MYMVIKEAVYEHGVFWIGGDLDQAINEANLRAAADKDDHHQWVVYLFESQPVTSDIRDACHKEIYKIKKGCTGQLK